MWGRRTEVVCAALVCVAIVTGVVSTAMAERVAEEIEVQIDQVHVRVTEDGPVVLLQVGERAIPIFVDPTVAGSIQAALSGRLFPRPLSHDLMHTILEAHRVRVDRVVISLKDGVYRGTLTTSFDGETKIFDSRSSDAIALAIHFRTPIVVTQDLLQTAGQPMSSQKENRTYL